MNPFVLHAIAAFWGVRRLARRLRTREDVQRWQGERLHRLFRHRIGRVDFYAGMDVRRLEDLPIVDKQMLLSSFERFNIRRLSHQAVRAALDAGDDRLDGLVIGQSTGTSGNRGIYVISEKERFTWLGVMLAKTLPDILFAQHKVALALPGYSRLYASAAETSRLALRFFDLSLGVDAWRAALCDFAPDTLVAPPKVLRALAEASRLRPTRVFSGAEVLDPLDRAVIEAAFDTPVREIYMATEGLFGVACPHGVLHLTEDVVAFEFPPARAGSGYSSDLVSPLVTDFTRSTQIMARYRMNDLLSLSNEPCPCGSPFQRVSSIAGREDDVFELQGEGGRLVMATPDVLRNAVVDADRRIEDFRIVQTAANRIEMTLARDVPEDVSLRAADALQTAVMRLGAVGIEIDRRSGLNAPFDRKLRRVRREWRP